MSGTNFYLMTSPNPNEWELIGSRSYVGWYCVDCGCQVYLRCPRCDREIDDLKAKPVSSFHWSQDPQETWENLAPSRGNIIMGNYRTYTAVEFFEMLSRMCPPELWNTKEYSR